MLGFDALGRQTLGAAHQPLGAHAAGVSSAGLAAGLRWSETNGVGGVASATAAGNVRVSTVIAALGIALIGSAGTVGWSPRGGISGVAAALAAGSVTQQSGPLAPGVAAAGGAGTIGDAQFEPLASVSSSGVAGAVVVRIADAPIGVSTTGSSGSTGVALGEPSLGVAASSAAGQLRAAFSPTLIGASSTGIAGALGWSPQALPMGATSAGVAGSLNRAASVGFTGAGSSGAVGGFTFVKGASAPGAAAAGLAGSFGMSISSFPVLPGAESAATASELGYGGSFGLPGIVAFTDAGYLYVEIVVPAPPALLRRSPEDYSDALADLLPVGAAWPRETDRTLMRLVAGLAMEWSRIDARAADLLDREADPRQTIEMLDSWETTFGLPDPCNAEAMTVEARQSALVARMTAIGGQSRGYFIRLAEALGYSIEIIEYAPYMAGISTCGDTRATTADGDPPRWQIGPETIRFYWSIRVRGSRLSWFRAGSGEAGVDHHLEFSLATDLECVLRRWKPAHTEIIFDYSGLASDGVMAGTP